MIQLFSLFHSLGDPSVKRLGLRSEIVLQLSLLMAAAIIFSGILIMKFAERELLNQRIQQSRSLLTLFSQTVNNQLSPLQIGQKLREQGREFFKESHLEAIAVINSERQVFSARFGKFKEWPVQQELNRALLTHEPSLRVEYQGLWENLFNKQDDFFLLTDWTGNAQGKSQVIQARFSLADIKGRAFHARGYLLVYILLFGLILILFGSSLLNKGIVKPITLLQSATEQISSGNLGHHVQIQGPKEISALADAFNRMSDALHDSHQKEKKHIAALEQANHELHKTRTELIQAAKMASIGHLAAGMAHEIGNPLGALTGYLDLIEQSPLSPADQDLIKAARAESARIDRLVRDLLDYARPENELPTLTDIPETLESSLRILTQQGVLQETRIKLECAEALPKIRISANRLQQVFINLLQNALDASLPDTPIEILANGSRHEVRIQIINQGEQIPPEQLTALFDPFYTTKAPDKGRGLGLFVCHNIVTDAGGRIQVTSSPAGQTCFSLIFSVVGDDHATA